MTEEALAISDELLAAVLGKVKRHMMRQYMAKVTPLEARALAGIGAVTSPADQAWMVAGREATSDSLRWVYFTASPALHKRLQEVEALRRSASA